MWGCFSQIFAVTISKCRASNSAGLNEGFSLSWSSRSIVAQLRPILESSVAVCAQGCLMLNIKTSLSNDYLFPKFRVWSERVVAIGKFSLFWKVIACSWNVLVTPGGIAMPGACLGIWVGGWLLKKLQLQPIGAVRLLISCSFMSLCMFCALFLFGCDNMKIAGATTDYRK